MTWRDDSYYSNYTSSYTNSYIYTPTLQDKLTETEKKLKVFEDDKKAKEQQDALKREQEKKMSKELKDKIASEGWLKAWEFVKNSKETFYRNEFASMLCNFNVKQVLNADVRQDLQHHGIDPQKYYTDIVLAYEDALLSFCLSQITNNNDIYGQLYIKAIEIISGRIDQYVEEGADEAEIAQFRLQKLDLIIRAYVCSGHLNDYPYTKESVFRILLTDGVDQDPRLTEALTFTQLVAMISSENKQNRKYKDNAERIINATKTFLKNNEVYECENLDTLKKMVFELQGMVIAETEKSNRLELENAELKSKVGELYNENQQLQEKLKAQELMIARLTAQMEAERRRSEKLVDDHANAIKAQELFWKEKVTGWETKFGEKRSTITSLEDDAKQSEQKIQSLTSTIESLTLTNKAANDANELLLAEKKVLSNKVSGIEEARYEQLVDIFNEISLHILDNPWKVGVLGGKVVSTFDGKHTTIPDTASEILLCIDLFRSNISRAESITAKLLMATQSLSNIKMLIQGAANRGSTYRSLFNQDDSTKARYEYYLKLIQGLDAPRPESRNNNNNRQI